MKNIVTITFNPAIDKSTAVEKLIPEHKMRTEVPIYYPGGGGVNIARALKKLGADATAVYFEGGASGKFFSELLARENIVTKGVPIAGSTRENFIVTERRSGKQFRFGLPGPDISYIELQTLLKEVGHIDRIDYLVISGSLPSVISLDVFKALKKIALTKNAKVVVDTSGEALTSALEGGIYLMKPSVSELAVLAGKRSLNQIQAIKFARQIIRSGKCEVIVISMGRDGAVLVEADRTFQVVAPQVNAVSTVGAGDSMLAGLLLSLARGLDFDAVLRYGVACGSAATLNDGTSLCDKDSVELLLQRMSKMMKKPL